ncbi:MAG TPA: helix-turn-helix transcriptional regulator [Conexibacter sp.]|jgi:transcriptional regulator with XRE-family HTH domain|nr:helix-turn-helix transcriptional regulator [Conexibacter sp.]
MADPLKTGTVPSMVPTGPPIEIALGRAIRRCRQTRRLSQRRLCEQAGLSLHLQAIETGQHTPTLPTLQRIADALQISLVELFLAAEGEQDRH